MIVLESEHLFLSERTLESHEEVGSFVFEDVGNRFGIGHNTLDLVELIALEIDFADERSESSLQKFYDFLSWVFIVGYHYIFTFTCLCAVNY